MEIEQSPHHPASCDPRPSGQDPSLNAVRSITVETNSSPPIPSSLMTEVQPPTSNGAALLAPHPSIVENNSGEGASNTATVPAGSSGAVVATQSGSQSPTTSTPGQSSSGRSPKKRRKVNHGMVILNLSRIALLQK